MAYTFKFLRGKKTVLRFPVPPSVMNISIKNQNKTISLINGKEINVLSAPGLKTIEFEALFPRVRYPFATYPKDPNKGEKKTKFLSKNKRSAKHFLSELAELKKSKKPFQFIIDRKSPAGKALGNTNIKVSLEDYVIKEDAEEGFDVKVAITLKEYREYGTKKYKKKPKTHKWTKGDSFAKLAKKYLGDSSRHTEFSKLNKIKNPGTIKIGQEIKIP